MINPVRLSPEEELIRRLKAVETALRELKLDPTLGGGSVASVSGLGAISVSPTTGATVVSLTDAELLAIAGLTSAADRLPYFTGSGTAALATFTTFGRSLVDDADATTARATLGAAASSHVHAAADITSGTMATARLGSGSPDNTNFLRGDQTYAQPDLANTAGTLPVNRGGTGATTASAARANLDVELGVDVQAYDATLAAFAAYNTNGLLTQTAADTFTGRTLTGTANQITVTNGSGVAGNPTLSFPTTIGVGGVTSPVKFATFSDVAAPTISGAPKGVVTAAAGDVGYYAKNTTTGAELYFGGFYSGGVGIGSITNTNIAFMWGGTERMTLTSTGLGIDINLPTSGIDLRNSMSWKQTVDSTTSYTALDTDFIINMTNVAARTVNLPAASTRTGRVYVIVDGANTATTAPITIDPNGAELINGAANFNVDKNRASALIYCDGTGWRVIASPGTFGGGTVTSITGGTGLSGGTITGSGTLALDINSLTTDATPDPAADFVPTYDVSAAAPKKIALSKVMLPQLIGRVVDTGDRTGAGTTDGTATAIAALTLTFTPVASVDYLIKVGQESYNSGANTGYLQAWDGTVGSGTKLAEKAQFHSAGSAFFQQQLAQVVQLTAVSHTINVGIKTSAGTHHIYGAGGVKSYLEIWRIT